MSLLERTETSSLLNFLEFSVTLKRDQDLGLWDLEALRQQKEYQTVRIETQHRPGLAQCFRVMTVALAPWDPPHTVRDAKEQGQ